MKRYRLLLFVGLAVALLTTINASGQQAGEPAPVPEAALRDVIATQEQYTPQLLQHPLAIGTGVSVDASGRGVIKVYASSAGVRGLPRELDGHPVVVQVTGQFVSLQNGRGKGNGKGKGGGGGSFDTTARHRPAPIGVSTGHPDITAGTIGARLVDPNGDVYALSNNHVYANLNTANIGDPVLQPGAFDDGTVANDTFGMLWDFNWLLFGVLEVNFVDAAIAKSSVGELDNRTPPDGYGVPKTEVIPPAVNMRVMKYGRTTGQTNARISDINVFTAVQYAPDFYLWFAEQILISGGGFSAGGDSGSLIVGARKANERKPVGLLFAGSSTSTLANRIDYVLLEFADHGVTIDGEG